MRWAEPGVKTKHDVELLQEIVAQLENLFVGGKGHVVFLLRMNSSRVVDLVKRTAEVYRDLDAAGVRRLR
jgi:uncharacterized NAD(P)/FAD-binding protein YdhS